MALSIGFLAFPVLTQLDMTGPLQVLGRLPNTNGHIIANTLAPVKSDGALMIPPTTTFAECAKLDVMCIPGGYGAPDAIREAETMAFVKSRGAEAAWVTSVNTGAFLLGAAGLPTGKRATTHWA